MKNLFIFLSNNKIKTILTIIFFLFLLNIFFSNSDDPALETKTKIKKKRNRRKTYANNKNEVNYKEAVLNPLLQNITITQIKTGVHPDEEEKDPKKIEIQRILAITNESLEKIKDQFMTIKYVGKMSITVPTMVDNEEDFDAGKRYGEGEEIKSSFVYKKDRNENFHLYQQTFSSSNNSSYDTKKLFNGNLYNIDDEYFFQDSSEENLQGDSLRSIRMDWNKARKEPLVRQSFIRIMKDISLVINFIQVKQKKNIITYKLEGINPLLQKKVTLLNKLKGQIIIDTNTDTMIEAKMEGELTYKDGYLSGAKSSFFISLKLTKLDSSFQVRSP